MEHLLDDQELARFLHVSIHWVKHHNDDGTLHPLKVGQKRLYKYSEIMASLENGEFSAKCKVTAQERTLRLRAKKEAV